MSQTTKTRDVDIIRLKAETNRLEVAAYLALMDLEHIESDVRALVSDLRGSLVAPSEEEDQGNEEQ